MPSEDVIYLDHAATTPIDADVLAIMLPWMTERFGNPSSIYQRGQAARAALDDARVAVARVLGCRPGEIVFTSGATESDNLAVKGVARAARLREPGRRPHIVTTAIEHHAVLHAAESLVREGWCDLTVVAPEQDGVVRVEAVAAAIRPETCLVAVMYANNETGAIQPVAEIARAARERGAPVFTDAVQAAGSLPLGVDALGCDLLALSAHKFHGPKGVGALYVRSGVPIDWQQDGGGQEQGRRGGTENVAGIAGMAAALAKAEALRPVAAPAIAARRDRLLELLKADIPGLELNGPACGDRRLPNNLNVAIPGIQGETMLLGLDMEGVAASAGSACTTGNAEPSHVLVAMGLPEERCRASLRFTLGRDTTDEDVEDAAAIVAEVAGRVRMLAGSR
ncbi:MAG: cysteine desulfurase family protein [Chloroflexota bacterium]